jgi:hypothetical protein
MTAHEYPTPELCSAEYSATIVPVPDGTPKIFITAQGEHSTSGFEVIFHRSPADVYPPEFSLWHVKSGPGLDVITPFTKLTAFDVQEKSPVKSVKSIVVVDASGRHTVTVKPIG